MHKSRAEPRGYANPQNRVHPTLDSPDSGLSDEYEPLHLEPVHVPRASSLEMPDGSIHPKVINIRPSFFKSHNGLSSFLTLTFEFKMGTDGFSIKKRCNMYNM